jgi:cytosine/adenosine deaminase-related metal-dependent hydrolase
MKKQENDLRVTVHAPYSCDIHLITTVKKRANRLHHLFPVHVAESRSEIEFLHTGKGEIHDFLVERGTWDDSFTPVSDKTAGSVLYLDRLGVLDERTLCVHAIHISQEEMDLLAKRKAKVCVCPGSNRYLGVGKAPVPDFLERGIVPALGTDSLTSNPQLDMWQEMKTLAQDHPGIDPAVIFAMATRGGAEALQNGESFGKLAPGMPANILEVKVGNLGQREVLDFLVTRGIDIMSKWVSVEGSL